MRLNRYKIIKLLLLHGADMMAKNLVSSSLPDSAVSVQDPTLPPLPPQAPTELSEDTEPSTTQPTCPGALSWPESRTVRAGRA